MKQKIIFQEKKHTIVFQVDLEKAFDKVKKEGLKVKLQKMQARGKMDQPLP